MSTAVKFRIFSTLIAIAILMLTSYARAEFTNNKCSRVLTHSKDIMIQRDWDENSRICFISLHPMNTTDLKYRDYYFDNAGLFLVFNSYGDGNLSESTGARGFMTFPQIFDYPDFSIEENGDVIVRTVSGHLIRINGEKFSVKEFSPGNFVEKELSPDNKGGLEITVSKGYLLDQGFRLGGMAIENKKGSTKVIGGLGGGCVLKNTKLYNYSSDQLELLYSRNELDQFIKQVCPEVKF